MEDEGAEQSSLVPRAGFVCGHETNFDYTDDVVFSEAQAAFAVPGW